VTTLVRAAAALSLVGSACGGGGTVNATTPTASPVIPEASETGTPFIPPTPTPEASETPFPFPSRLPPTIPVYGAIQVEVRRFRGSGGLQGPTTITMAWTVQGIEEEVRLAAQNLRTGDFRMVLPPGETYQLTDMDVNDPAFGFESAGLVPYGPNGGGPMFTVPPSGCLYMGRMTFAYIELPPGDSLDQLALAGEIAHDQSLAILFTGAGTFVYLPDDPGSHRFQMPPAKRRPGEARDCRATRPTFGS
jgi:hypothetical protein